MKSRILSGCAMVAMFFAMTMPTAISSAAASPEPHPEIRAAISSLERARTHLKEAAHDFGGHRVDALKATDEAIHQLQICLQYDKD